MSDKDCSLSREDTGKPKSRRGVSNINRKNNDEAQDDSYGDSDYYDEEGSCYDSENGDVKENLEYDDGQEYSPLKETTYPESLIRALPKTDPLNKVTKDGGLANKTIDGTQVFSSKQIECPKVTKFDTFGTP